MGLDTSHDAWHGAYSAFMRWRTEIARLAGMPPLMAMESFWHGGSHLTSMVANIEPQWVREAFHREIFNELPIKWASLKPDPLHALLHHSDCDGEIAPEDCVKIADRLEELLPLFPAGDGGGHIGDWRDKTQKFIDGCRAAAAANEPLDFH